MSLIDRDVIMRQLRFMQQLLARAKKAQAQNDFAGALHELRSGYREALGTPYELLSQLDAGSARLMLRTPERQRAYRELLLAEAELWRAQGEADAAGSVEKRLSQLALAAPR
ncbi:MAG TPA: hypothetical protein PLW65_22715 [Pseudomonadota bacterium]|nr:hypothetical protein [Pseudomonadota bacterium]